MNCILHQLVFPFSIAPASENLTRNRIRIRAGSDVIHLFSGRLTTELMKSSHTVVNVNNGVLSNFSLLFLKLFSLRYVVMMKSKAFCRPIS